MGRPASDVRKADLTAFGLHERDGKTYVSRDILRFDPERQKKKSAWQDRDDAKRQKLNTELAVSKVDLSEDDDLGERDE